MKALITVLCAAAVLLVPTAWSADQAQTAASSAVPAQSLTVAPQVTPGVVPSGKLYVLLDDSGKQIQKFKAGQQTPLATTDCAQVTCPSTFEKGVVCWKCKERIKAK